MNSIWSRQARYERWKDVEVAICEAHAQDGTIPASDMAEIRTKAAFDLDRCDELERETRHDLVAFVRNLEENVGPAGRWIHFGVTSYDVIDTATGMMLRDSADVLLKSADRLRAAIDKLEAEHGSAPQIGRTHGVHAEPITFGHKCRSWRNELDRNVARLKSAKEEIAVGKISGPVGIHGITSPEQFDAAVGPVISEALGVKMADTLRSGQAVKLHPGLMVSKAGVIVFKGRKKIGIKWSQADIKVVGGQLIIGAAGKNGRFKTVRRYPADRVDNLGGFLDLSEVMLTAHQPNRRSVV